MLSKFTKMRKIRIAILRMRLILRKKTKKKRRRNVRSQPKIH